MTHWTEHLTDDEMAELDEIIQTVGGLVIRRNQLMNRAKSRRFRSKETEQ